MNTQEYIHVLRVQLLGMSRLAQRAVDEAIKGYELRNLDFSHHVCSVEQKLGEHHRHIKDLCRRLIGCGISAPSEFRLVLTTSEIASALQIAYTAAAQIAQHTAVLLEKGSKAKCGELDTMGQLVNGLMRLCIVALFNENSGYARTVLQNQEAGQLCARICDGLHDDSNKESGSETDGSRALDLSIARLLEEIARQTHEIAGAVLFGLERRHLPAISGESVEGLISFELLQAQHDAEVKAAVCCNSHLGAKGN
jgi:phosphate uptake regulator